jgi:glycosyltransferase involved in cell wall biosynthesis
MKVMVIPSWYPSRRNPLGGIFCREQAEALAECADCDVFVCDWGQKDGALSLSEPLSTWRNLLWRLRARRAVRHRGRHFFEFFEPTCFWSSKFPGGGNQRILGAIRHIRRRIQRQFGELDIIHAHVSNPGGYVAQLLAAESGVPYVLTEHWGMFPGNLINGRPSFEIEAAMHNAAAVVSVSRSAAKKIQSFGYQRVRVIPNLVDEDRFMSKSAPNCIFRFFSMGGLTKVKGFDILLRAIAQWSPRAGEVEFVIAGEGAMKSEYQRLAVNLGISGLIRWVGAVSREAAPSYFQDSHAFVMASRSESFGIVFAEAIASGRPVIATRCGGPEDIVNDVNGILVPVEDVAALAAALVRMKEEYRRFDAAAIREDFMRRFSRMAVTAQIRTLYAGVIGKK